MTREEAKRFGHCILAVADADTDKDTIEFTKVALEALEQEPCDDAISRQAVLDLMRSLTRWCVRSEDGKFDNVGLLYDDVMFGIDKLPSVNPQEPKTGHWIRWYEKISYENVTEYNPHCKCSECNTEYDPHTSQFIKYCNFCGAKMESED